MKKLLAIAVTLALLCGAFSIGLCEGGSFDIGGGLGKQGGEDFGVGSGLNDSAEIDENIIIGGGLGLKPGANGGEAPDIGEDITIGGGLGGVNGGEAPDTGEDITIGGGLGGMSGEAPDTGEDGNSGSWLSGMNIGEAPGIGEDITIGGGLGGISGGEAPDTGEDGNTGSWLGGLNIGGDLGGNGESGETTGELAAFQDFTGLMPYQLDNFSASEAYYMVFFKLSDKSALDEYIALLEGAGYVCSGAGIHEGWEYTSVDSEEYDEFFIIYSEEFSEVCFSFDVGKNYGFDPLSGLR